MEIDWSDINVVQIRLRVLISKLLTENAMNSSKALDTSVQYDADISLETDALKESERMKYRSSDCNSTYLATR